VIDLSQHVEIDLSRFRQIFLSEGERKAPTNRNSELRVPEEVPCHKKQEILSMENEPAGRRGILVL